jgi:nicotinamidase-related amidase
VALVGAPDLPWLQRQVLDYCRRLEETGRHQLFLWPPHCLVGSSGHALVGIVDEARLFHCFARDTNSVFVSKGEALLTENYSVLAPEVELAHDGSRLGARDLPLLERLLAADRLILAGQASSHCVAETVFDLLAEIEHRAPEQAGKVYLLEDCMSAVTVPDGEGGYHADFTSSAAEMFERARAAGMNVVRSSDSMRSWPEESSSEILAAQAGRG